MTTEMNVCVVVLYTDVFSASELDSIQGEFTGMDILMMSVQRPTLCLEI